jgi:2-dehydro-3-deoxyphosphogluconate aldolase/(4S)-4-hydroxy-2-oxoglutarate aldolase
VNTSIEEAFIMKSIYQLLKSVKVIPVMVIHHLDDAIPMAKALINAGLTVLEVTLRTPVALKAIEMIKLEFPLATVGTGTVVNAQTLEASLNAGADFLVSPGTSPDLLSAAKANQALLLPGASTVSEVMLLQSYGYECIKFFPAENAGGTAMLKAFLGPLPQMKFCPTGGIQQATAQAYLSLSNVMCVGGSWMLPKAFIQKKQWAKIHCLALKANEC